MSEPPGQPPGGEVCAAADERALVVAAARHRSRAALAALFDRHFERLYGFVLAQSADPELAEDVTAETFHLICADIATLAEQAAPFGERLHALAVRVLAERGCAVAATTGRASVAPADPAFRTWLKEILTGTGTYDRVLGRMIAPSSPVMPGAARREIAAPSAAPPPDARATVPRTMAALERGLASRLHIGVQLYASRAGAPLADLAVGEARQGVALASDMLMLWMSSVKPVLAVAVAQQWERGRLGLDDPVAAHVPEFGTRGKETITIRHVLTHTGGFRAPALQWSATAWHDIVAEICAAPLEPGWVPGRDAGYHVASGWYVLAEVVRRLDGRPFDRYVREAIFVPLGLHDSWVGMPRERHRAYGGRIVPMHDTTGPEPVMHSNWAWAGTPEACALCRPGGSGWGPIRELAWFYEALLAGGARGGGRVLRPQTVEALTTRHIAGRVDRTFGVALDRGLGFVVDSKTHGPAGAWYGPHCSPRAFGHGGYASSVAFADPEHGLAVALVFNGMAAPERHAARVHATLAAVYEDLGLA